MRTAILIVATAFLLVVGATTAPAAEWEFVLLWQQPIAAGVAALAAGDLKGGPEPEIAIATWQNDIRILSCSGEPDTSFSAPPTKGNITLLTIGRGEKTNFVAAAGLWQPHVTGYAHDGRRLWEYEDLKGAGVAGISTVRRGNSDVVVVAYTAKPGVRVLDENGGVVSTISKLNSSFFVAGLDSNGNGREEILSVPEKLVAPPKTSMAFYNLAGEPVGSVPFPGHTSLVVTADVNNDGNEDIISYYGTDTVTLGAWSRTGKEIWKTELKNLFAPSAIVAADFNGDKKKEIIAAFPQGQIIVFKDGKQVAAAQAQQRYPRIAAADVDSDGRDELLVGDGKGLRAFKLRPRTPAQ